MSFMFRLCLALLILTPVLAHAEVLENPGPGQNYSGIGVIAGWKCRTNGPLTVRFNGGEPIPLVYGSERSDTSGVCGDTDNGFVAIWNWASLGDGEHTAVVYDNGVEFARSTFEVGTLGEEFVRGAAAEVRVENFPSAGESVLLAWNQNTQHFEVVLESPSGFAPIDQAAFDRLVVGKRAVSADDPRYYLTFPSAGRFVEYEPGERYPGSYRYSNTGPNTGTITQNYDDGDRCVTQFTFTSPTTGSSNFTCDDGDRGGSNWRLAAISPGDSSDGGNGAAGRG